MKTENIEIKRNLEKFELDYINSHSFKVEIKVLKIYNSIGSNWNLFLIQNEKEQYFVSIPKTDKKCSPSGYGSMEHAKQYNNFTNLD